jgi:hypothetical protein
MVLFPSDDWLETYRRRINESAEYRDAAATWEGDVAFLLERWKDVIAGESIPSTRSHQ